MEAKIIEVKNDTHGNLTKNEKTTPVIIGINGTWYNISAFIKYHPGGEQVLKDFVGKDATVVFRVWHKYKVLPEMINKGLIHPCKTNPKYSLNLDILDKKLLCLHSDLISNNAYKLNKIWMVQKILFIVACYAISFFGLKYAIFYENENRNKYKWVPILKYFSAPFLTLAWQQCGLLMHDCQHSSLTFNRAYDNFFGWLFGTVGICINSCWWKSEHNIHHLYTNTIDTENDVCTDPQMQELFWCQNVQLSELSNWKRGYWQKIFFTIQKYTWLPMVVLISRYAIICDSFFFACNSSQTNIYQWFGFILHHAILYVLFIQQILNMNEDEKHGKCAIFWYFIASTFQGLLALQLLVSHYDKSVEQKRNVVDYRIGWLRRQSNVVKDIINYPCMDWFYGGLNFHFVHHALPKLPRCKARGVDVRLRAILREEGIFVDRVGFLQAIVDVVLHMGSVADKIGIYQVLKKVELF